MSAPNENHHVHYQHGNETIYEKNQADKEYTEKFRPNVPAIIKPAKPRKLLVFHNPRNYRPAAEVLLRRTGYRVAGRGGPAGAHRLRGQGRRPLHVASLGVHGGHTEKRDTAEPLDRRETARGEKAFALRDDNDYAVSWLKPHGQGRVFYTSLGHAHETIADPRFLKHILAAIQYACGDLKP